MVLSKEAERDRQLTTHDLISSDDAIHVTKLKDKVKKMNILSPILKG